MRIFAPTPIAENSAPHARSRFGGGRSLTLSLTGKWGPNSGVGDQNFFGGGPHFIVMMNKKSGEFDIRAPTPGADLERGGGRDGLHSF